MRAVSEMVQSTKKDGSVASSWKWAKIAKCSQDSAGRDIKNLIERGALRKDPGGGRSTSYSIVQKNMDTTK